MPINPTYPGVYVAELPSSSHTITGVSTSVTVFLGRTPVGVVDTPTQLLSFADYQRAFGPVSAGYPLGDAVSDFFNAGGAQAFVVRLSNAEGDAPSGPLQLEDYRAGLEALDSLELFNLMCIPPDRRDGDTAPAVYAAAVAYAEKRRAMLIVDPPVGWDALARQGRLDDIQPTDLGVPAGFARNAAVYFPRYLRPDYAGDRVTTTFPASGLLAGIYARTDAQQGVWKAPAGLDASLTGATGLAYSLTEAENGPLNSRAVNCLRDLSDYGIVVWGARTLAGSDAGADEYKYVPTRRLALYVEQSLLQGTRWTVFEPNDEPLWSTLRQTVGVFMNDLFTQGALQGNSPKEAYFVNCDSSTTTQADIELGIVTLIVGFAPLKPAEFVVLTLQLKAGS